MMKGDCKGCPGCIQIKHSGDATWHCPVWADLKAKGR